MAHGKLHGRGKKLDFNGNSYGGEFVFGNRNGLGKNTWAAQGNVYEVSGLLTSVADSASCGARTPR